MCPRTKKEPSLSSESNPEKKEPCSVKKFGHPRGTFQWLLGMFLSSVFSVIYLLTPTYFILALVCVLFQYPSKTTAFVLASPIVFSALFTKPINGSPTLFRCLRPILHYFQYEEILECSNEELFQSNKRYIVASQPHGVVRA